MNFFASFNITGKAAAKKTDPQELGKEWKRNLQKEIRSMDRDILNVKRAETKAVNECKALAKKGRTGAAKILAKEIVNTRKTIERMHTAKAQLSSVQSNLQVSMSMMKMQGVIGKSAEIMHSMNSLVNVSELADTMNSMAREMERAGLIDEIVSETLESLEPDGLETDADAEIDRILTEITGGILAPASSAPTAAVATQAQTDVADLPTAEGAEAEAEGESTQELLSRLQAL